MNERYDVDELRKVVAESVCMTDVCRSLNITVCSFNFKRIAKLCDEHSIPREHFDAKSTMRRNKRTWTKEEIFSRGSKYSRCNLRKAAKRFNVYTGVCEECGIGDTWMGRPLTIELDHINGINDDNRLENLRWLCPNCHSQTSTHKNSKNRNTSTE